MTTTTTAPETPAESQADLLAEIVGTEGAAKAERDTPPKRSTTRRKTAAKPATKTTAKRTTTAKPGRPPRGNLRRRLEDQLTMLGHAVRLVDEFDGQAIVAGAPALAEALDALAAENPAVARLLESAMQASAWGQVLTALAGIALPILAHHGLLGPAGFLFAAGDVLDGQAKAEPS